MEAACRTDGSDNGQQPKTSDCVLDKIRSSGSNEGRALSQAAIVVRRLRAGLGVMISPLCAMMQNTNERTWEAL